MRIPTVGTLSAGDSDAWQDAITPPDATPPTPKRAKLSGLSRRIRAGLRLSSLPEKFDYEEHALHDLRRAVWVELEGMYGEGVFPVFVDATLQTALRHEQRALFAAKLLRHEKQLTLGDRLQLLDAIAKSSDARDKALRSLGLDPREVTSGRNSGQKSNGVGNFAAITLPAIPPPPEPLADGRSLSASHDPQPVEQARPPDAGPVIRLGIPPIESR